MLINTSRRIEITLLTISLILIFILEYFFRMKAGVRISWGNFAVGVTSSIFTFIIFNFSNFLLLLIRGSRFYGELNSNKIISSNIDLIAKAIFISAIEQLLITVLIFGSLIKTLNPLFAYSAASIISYLIHFERNKPYLAISYAIFGLFSCFLYQLHSSYFLVFVSSCFFWIIWLTYLKSGYFIRNCLEVLNIRKMIVARYVDQRTKT